MLVEFWSRLEGPVHPDDASTFAGYGDGHGFNLQYPPPAYWGDVRTAPILILDNNGGFDAEETPKEFTSANAVAQHLRRLREPGPINLSEVPPYYRRLNFSDLLADGRAALVNAVAYRSVDAKGLNVKRIAASLPSGNLHRRWLHEFALPAAHRGERLVIFNRWSLWNLKAGQTRGDSIIWSAVPRSPNLTKYERAAVDAWLLAHPHFVSEPAYHETPEYHVRSRS